MINNFTSENAFQGILSNSKQKQIWGKKGNLSGSTKFYSGKKKTVLIWNMRAEYCGLLESILKKKLYLILLPPAANSSWLSILLKYHKLDVKVLCFEFWSFEFWVLVQNKLGSFPLATDY